jgi:uncharacterized protein (TIGR00369 family)
LKADGGPPAHSLVDVRRSLSGLEFFRQMMAGTIPPPPMVSLLGLRMVEAEQGRVVFTGTATEAFYNGMGVAHGGFAATLLDSALGCAINTMMPAGRSFTTLELKINYTRPLRRETGEVTCEAKVIHVGSRVGTAEARVVDADGKVYAHGTTTCILVEPPRGDRGDE